jgi:hypothetical protein
MSTNVVNAKFYVASATPSYRKLASEQDPREGLVGEVKLSPVMPEYDREKREYKESENKQFWDATPAGQITLQIQNPDGFRPFLDALGKVVRIAFTISDESGIPAQ